jgi:hypothetical protein
MAARKQHDNRLRVLGSEHENALGDARSTGNVGDSFRRRTSG